MHSYSFSKYAVLCISYQILQHKIHRRTIMKKNFKTSLATRFILLVLTAIISSSATTILTDSTITSSNNGYIETFNDIDDTPPVKQ